MTTALALSSYRTLLLEIEKVLAEGRLRARQAIEEEKVKTYWQVGKLINEHLRLKGGRAVYGQQVIRRLAADLKISERLLWDILRFQRTFDIVQTSAELTWSHYTILSRIEDAEKRHFLLKETLRHKWTVRELLNRVEKMQLDTGADDHVPLPLEEKPDSPKSSPLIPRRGIFYLYRLLQTPDLHEGPETFSLDLGFNSRIQLGLKGIAKPQEGQIVEAARTHKNSQGDEYRFKKSPALLSALYTYKALVEKVIDDDTLWVHIDLGFRVWTKQKLRLRGVNAAEIEKGKPASHYVKKVLARVPFVVVKLSSRDKYDRYLTDLFYLEGAEDRQKVLTEGRFLNQELLDLGLAERM